MRYLLLVALAMLAGPALAGEPFLAGKPGFSVTDGDTVKYGKQAIRLFGIDAPEKEQTCDDGTWLPGPLAKQALIDFIGGRPVVCYQVDYDKRNKRPVGQCFAGDDDLQAMMVAAGWAWAFTQFSDRYGQEERDAIARKAGVHAHRCMPPWDWRARQRADSKAR